MEEKINSFLKRYTNEQFQALILQFFKIQFSIQELNQVMPFIRSDWMRAAKAEEREQFLKELAGKCNPETMQKIHKMMDIAINYYGLTL